MLVARSIRPARRTRTLVGPRAEAPRWPGLRTTGLAALGYLACVAIATYPALFEFGKALPGELTDPLEHLGILRWSKACLLEGQSPFFIEGLQYPTGVPLGYFPTMHLQTAFYLAMGLVTSNDVACFQVIWAFGFVSTGLSTFLLAWWGVREAGPAWLAGLGTMLCGPMMMHAHGHLETMQLGAVPLFLVAWIRFVDLPDRGRLAMAAALYLFMVAAAPYFAVLAVFPATWYLVWSFLAAGHGYRKDWSLGRVGWLIGFAGLVVPGLLALFAAQVWASLHGFSMARSKAEFHSLGAPYWSGLLPSPRHALGRFAMPDLFRETGYASRMSECSSYLGLMTLALLIHGAARRIKFPRAGYWWSVLGLMVVLSWGSHLRVGSVKVGLPAGWIYGVFPPFHLIRVPARFNLFAAVCAAVPASASLVDLARRSGGFRARIFGFSGVSALMVLDLAMTPFPTSPIPPMPAAYRELVLRKPRVALVDAPMFGSDDGQLFSSLWGYWQSFHGAKTTAGYPGLANSRFDDGPVANSPFWARRLADPAYLADPRFQSFGPLIGQDARSYAWLYLTTHGFDHLIVHQGPHMDGKYAPGCGRIKALLGEARSSEDADSAVFDVDRLAQPDRVTSLFIDGWKAGRVLGSFGFARRSNLRVFLPIGRDSFGLRLDRVTSTGQTRLVRLQQGTRELARWTVGSGPPVDLDSGPIRLGPGLHDLTIESDGEDRPTRPEDRLDEARTPYSLRLRSVRID